MHCQLVLQSYAHQITNAYLVSGVLAHVFRKRKYKSFPVSIIKIHYYITFSAEQKLSISYMAR